MDNYKALEIWTAQTLLDIGILLSFVSFLLHIGRPYFERIQARISLRVAADMWWLIFVILRDGSLFLAVFLTFLNMNLDLMADIKMGLPFVPLATLTLTASLLIKIFRNAEDFNFYYKLNNYLISIGALFNFIGFVFVMEAPGAEYATSKSPFWQFMTSLRSNKNPELATMTFYFTIVCMILVIIFALVKFKKSIPDKKSDV
ncbi:MAG: hypothetical protein NT007_06960 [Candidatus Kapabacteria bacterium]|nr:hypothetical protein [Candidatus Kapabacteria bacterium]